MRYYLGLATTFHDPALAIIGPDGRVLFAEATERYLQYKRAPNCEPDPAPRTASLLGRFIPPGAEIVMATSWGQDFTDFLSNSARSGAFDLEALARLSPDLNRSLVPERSERACLIERASPRPPPERTRRQCEIVAFLGCSRRPAPGRPEGGPRR